MARLKRLLKRLAIGLALLVAVLLLVNAGYGWWIGRQLQQRLAKLRAAGEPTSFAELAPQPIPPEQDAAARLAQLAPKLEAFAKEHGAFFKTPEGKTFYERQDRGLEPTPAQVAAIRAILAHYEDLPQRLQQAAACPGYASRIDYSVGYPQMMEELLPHANAVRTPARLLRWRITVLLADGKVEEAVHTGLTILRLARHFQGEPALVSGLVAMAVRGIGIEGINLTLRAGPVPTQLRKQLDAQLARQDDPQWIVRMMKTERAFSLSASQDMFARAWWLPWLGKGLQLDMLDFYDQSLPVLARPWRESHPQITRLDNVTHRTYVSGISIQLLVPALQAVLDAAFRDVAALRCLRVVNALAGYAQQTGRQPTGLVDLELPRLATIDPFSGAPLKLKQTADGWVVYSVFKNGIDDGGNFKDQADGGLAPAGYPGSE